MVLLAVVVGGLICEALWPAAAPGCRAGRHWGRVLGAACFVPGAAGLLIRVFTTPGLTGHLLVCVTVLAAGTAVVLLFHPGSAPHFRPPERSPFTRRAW